MALFDPNFDPLTLLAMAVLNPVVIGVAIYMGLQSDQWQKLVVVGFASGDIPRFPVNLVLLKRCSIVGVNWGGHISENPSTSREVLTTLLEWVTQGKIKPSSSDTYGLAETGIAMMKMLDRKAIGKIVIHPHE